MWNACCTVHYMWRHTLSVIYPVLFFLFKRGENRVKLCWNLKCEGNRGWVLFSGMTSGDLSGTDQGPGTDLSGTSEPLRSRMRSRSSRDLASPLHRWVDDISNYRSSMAFICLNGRSSETCQDLLCLEISCCWRLFKFYIYGSFFKRTSSAFDLVLSFPSTIEANVKVNQQNHLSDYICLNVLIFCAWTN